MTLRRRLASFAASTRSPSRQGLRTPTSRLPVLLSALLLGAGGTSLAHFVAACSSSGTPEQTVADAASRDAGIDVPFEGFDVGPPNDTGEDTYEGDSGCDLNACAGQCHLGRCVLVLSTSGAYDVAVQSGVVYWTNPGATPGAGTVMSLSLRTTQSAATEWSFDQDGPAGLAVNATSLYWADNSLSSGTIVTALLSTHGVPDSGAPDGGSRDAALDFHTVAAGQVGPAFVALDDRYVYWTAAHGLGVDAGGHPKHDGGSHDASTHGSDATTDGGVHDGIVVRAPLAGGAPVTLASGLANPGALTVDGTNVYWVDLGQPRINIMPTGSCQSGSGGAVLKMPKAGGAVTTLASDQNVPTGIAVDSSSVYWAELGTCANTSAIVKASLTGGDVTTLAGGLGVVGGMTIDSSSVYFTVASGSGDAGHGTGTVMSTPLTATAKTAPTTLATGLLYPFAIVTDSTSAYWTDAINGTVTALTPKD